MIAHTTDLDVLWRARGRSGRPSRPSSGSVSGPYRRWGSRGQIVGERASGLGGKTSMCPRTRSAGDAARLLLMGSLPAARPARLASTVSRVFRHVAISRPRPALTARSSGDIVYFRSIVAKVPNHGAFSELRAPRRRCRSTRASPLRGPDLGVRAILSIDPAHPSGQSCSGDARSTLKRGVLGPGAQAAVGVATQEAPWWRGPIAARDSRRCSDLESVPT